MERYHTAAKTQAFFAKHVEQQERRATTAVPHYIQDMGNFSNAWRVYAGAQGDRI